MIVRIDESLAFVHSFFDGGADVVYYLVFEVT
jgi:hypothetical protein